MPALLAYVVAIGLFLGGGYGVLNWLAAPEPVKVAVKAKPASRPAPPVAADLSTSDVADASAQGARPDSESQPIRQENRPEKNLLSANAAVPATTASEGRQVPGVEPGAAPKGLPPETTAARPTPAKPTRRNAGRQASEHLRRPLVIMTLRTIEYPDGRRVQQLLPYREPRQAMAFQRDD